MVYNKRKLSLSYGDSPRYPVRIIPVQQMNSPTGFSPGSLRSPFNTPGNGSRVNNMQWLAQQPQFSGGFSQTNTQTRNRTQENTYRVRGQRAYLGGKIKKLKRVSRKKSYRTKKGKKMLSRLGMNNLGLHLSEEVRFLSKTDTATKYEAIQVGHTTMPGAQVLMHTARALIKYVFRNQFPIQNFNDICAGSTTVPNATYSMCDDDVVKFVYYADWQTNTLNTFSITLGENWRFEDIAIDLVKNLIAIADDGNFDGCRWERVEYRPSTNSKRQPFNVSIKYCTVHCELKSSLKVQNRTINSTGNDTTEDVDNVPLQGFLYHLKGNNLFNKSSRKVLEGVKTGSESVNNEIVLYDAITRSDPTYNGDLKINVQTPFNPTDYTAFNKPSEPAKPYEIMNCLKAAKVRMNPGSIKTSTVSQKFNLPLVTFLQILCADYAAFVLDSLRYNPKKGLARVMHLEKVIGNPDTSVVIAAEVQYDAWIAVTGKSDEKYTIPVLYQKDIGTFP